jgi:hypothetical protein
MAETRQDLHFYRQQSQISSLSWPKSTSVLELQSVSPFYGKW